MKKYFQNKNFVAGFILFSLVLVLMLVGFIHLPYDPNAIDITNKFAPCSYKHLLGTDHLGRDLLSRIMVGSRVSIFIGVIVMLFSFVIGTVIGSLCGYFQGKIDSIVMKLNDSFMAFPGLLLALMLIAVFSPSLKTTIVALTFMAIPRFVRISRSGFMKLKPSLFVMNAKSKGASNLRIMLCHILPNAISDLIVTSSLTFSLAVLNESGLSYLGLGVQKPDASFGNILSDAQRYILQSPQGVIIPAVILTVLVLGVNLLGDGYSEVNEH